MRVRITNYVGVREAELEIGPGITLIAGDNAVGKTSVLRGVATLVTGQIKPKDIGSGDFAVMVAEGHSAAELVLAAKKGSVTVAYPNPQYVAQGDPPHASTIAAGSRAYTDLEERERSRFLTTLLKADPSSAALRKMLKKDLAEEEIETIVKMLEAHSWDEVVEKMRERRVRLKGRWEEITGERFGDSKAKHWVPKGWEDRDAQPSNEIQARVTIAQGALDQLSREAVIGEVEYNTLRDLIGKREPTQMSLDMAQRQLPTIEAEWARLRGELEALPEEVEPGVSCPHCGAHVVVRHYGGKGVYVLEPLEPMTEGEPERRRRARREKGEAVAQAYHKLEYQQGIIGAAQEKLREIAKAEQRLKGVKKGNGEHPDEKLRQAQEALERAQASAARAKLARDAAEVADRVEFHSLVIEILGPDGLRRQEMERKLTSFEAELLTLTKKLVTWKPITIDRANLMPRWGARPYLLCSKSEQWRLNVTLQVLIGLLEGADIICIDGADILARKSQEDLLTGLLDNLPVPVLVGATYDRPKDAPDLEAAEMGRVYWIADGVLASKETPVT